MVWVLVINAGKISLDSDLCKKKFSVGHVYIFCPHFGSHLEHSCIALLYFCSLGEQTKALALFQSMPNTNYWDALRQ